ncbi:rod-binding protein [Engelhardtia mirabilis]|uniref:Flagellar rod assembly protein/muramidase FlgJ n=1 Tax=Engelhardtia mirabilis TaxID=2528011 RepID=A0A518BSY1_9BACT|nr:flagellar rod assembly protein/muramidase FlgJ [Planctomycetes bacterium Pla133]QDV04405.1 flagellar rod assembly protein/muramidase FlgJ [Planctomycetes bacterium Pla86]
MIDNNFDGLTRAREAGIDAGIGGLRKADQLKARMQNAGVDKVAREFERLFASMLVKEMRATLQDGMFGKGAGSDTYGAWFDEHIGASLADTGALDMAGILRAGLPQGEVISAETLEAERKGEAPPADDEVDTAADARPLER